MKIIKTISLTDRWKILVISSLDDVVAEIDRLTGGKYYPQIKLYVDSFDDERLDYRARNEIYKIRDVHIAAARMNVGEQDLDLPESYSPVPIRLGRNLVGIGNSETIGGPNTEYVHYCYLELPEDTTSVTVKGQTIDIKHNELSRAIKVNQVGYLPSATKKFAYIGCHIYDVGPLIIDSTSFDIVNANTGEIAFTGPITLRDMDSTGESGKSLNGEFVYELNFSSLIEEGEFYIQVDGVGKSYTFKHTPDVYGEVFYTSTRGMYHQRCGVQLRAPYTNWPRIKCHSAPVCESKYVEFPRSFAGRPNPYERFSVYAYTTDTSSTVSNVIGGWHDAADWDRNSMHYTNVFDLLYAYELQPQKFKRNQLNIPESSNILPDILDEAAFGLGVWKRSMNAAGGISGMVETFTHPKITVDGAYAFSVRTRWDSLMFASAAAMLAEFCRPIDAGAAKQWEWYARKAYSFGNNPANSLGTIKIPYIDHNTGLYGEYTFTETEDHIIPFLAHAKVRMSRMMNDPSYLKGLDLLIPKIKPPAKFPYNNKDYSIWFAYGLLNYIPDTLKASLTKKWFIDPAEYLMKHVEGMPYRCTWPKEKDFWLAWGASNVCNESRFLFIAEKLTGNKKYRDAAILNLDFMLGVNPMGMSWTTGIGKAYPINIQHEVSTDDKIDDPVPGIGIYGVTGGVSYEMRQQVYNSPSPAGPVEFKVPKSIPTWRGWTCHETSNVKQCEFTIHETMSATIFSSAMLLSDNWYPNEELKYRKPKPKEQLDGLYYLP